jgi:hypothetical protein
MSRIPLAGLVVAGFALIVHAVRAEELKPGKFGWHSDYALAKAEARRSGKPLMVVFRCEP